MVNESVDTTEEAGNEPESANQFEDWLVNLSLDSAIKQVLDKAEARERLGDSAGKNKLIDAEEDICIAVRRAYTSYLETMGWLGFADRKATKDLESALTTARNVLTLTDFPFLYAVSERINALHEYVKQHPFRE